jgi:tetratricopeptide (TPR) repeat protein
MDTRLAAGILTTLRSSRTWALAAGLVLCSNFSAGAVAPAVKADNSAPSYATALKEIDALTQARSFYKARKILEPLLESKAKDASVHVRAGRLFSQMGLLPRAIDEYRTVITLDPRNSSAYVELSKIYLASENTNDATTYAKEALKLNPNSADTRILLVKILMAKGLLLEAEQELQRLLRGDPHDAQVHYMAAKIYRERGQGTLALQHIDQAIQLNPNNHEWLMEMSDICILLGRDEEAKAALVKLLKYEPDSVEGLNRLARVKENSFRDYDGAMECYKRVLEIDPDSVTALAGIERLRAKKNDLAGLWKHQLRNFWSSIFQKKN